MSRSEYIPLYVCIRACTCDLGVLSNPFSMPTIGVEFAYYLFMRIFYKITILKIEDYASSHCNVPRNAMIFIARPNRHG